MVETTQSDGNDPNQQAKGTILYKDGIEFEAIERGGLKAVPVMPQALDNQWLPNDLLEEAIKAGGVTSSIEKQREELVRAEYIHSLVNGEQVVINRAYLYNNPIIYQDFLPAKNISDAEEVHRANERREAFKRLLQHKVLVPYLLAEESPVQSPVFSTLSFEEWKKVCQEVRMQCVRLSWDDQRNKDYAERFISGKFVDAVLVIASPHKDFAKYIHDLGLDPATQEDLKKQFRGVMRTAMDLLDQKDAVNREDIYKAFVTAGDKPAERRYDSTKPFAGKIKQLIDLAYNRNLPDALNGYLLTPIDSLPRTALQETTEDLAAMPEVTVDDLNTLLRRDVFSLVQEGQYLQSMDLLSLSDVLEIRRMEEWYVYINSLKALLKDPFALFAKGRAEGGARDVQESYDRLAKQMTKLVEKRYMQEKEKFVAPTTFVMELIIEIGGAVLTVVGMPHSGPVIQSAVTAALPKMSEALPFAARFVIRDIAKKRANKGLSTSLELKRGKMKDAAQQWEALQRLVNKEFPGGQVSPDKAPNLTPPAG